MKQRDDGNMKVNRACVMCYQLIAQCVVRENVGWCRVIVRQRSQNIDSCGYLYSIFLNVLCVYKLSGCR